MAIEGKDRSRLTFATFTGCTLSVWQRTTRTTLLFYQPHRDEEHLIKGEQEWIAHVHQARRLSADRPMESLSLPDAAPALGL